jgi:hypothetical protein
MIHTHSTGHAFGVVIVGLYNGERREILKLFAKVALMMWSLVGLVFVMLSPLSLRLVRVAADV